MFLRGKKADTSTLPRIKF